MIAYLNGEYMDRDSIHISPDDRGFLFADGIYEVIRAYQGKLFLAEDHQRRMEEGAQAMRLNAAQVPDLAAIGAELIARNGLESERSATVYVQVTRGAAPRSHAFPPPDTPLTIYAAARAFKGNYEEQETGARVITVQDERWGRCNIKTIALLPNTLAHQQAREAGASEAIFIRDGMAQEGTHSNVCVVHDGTLHTPPLTNHILPGVTRKAVLQLCGELSIPVVEAPVPSKDLCEAEEVMIVGTAVEITPVVEVDGNVSGPGTPGPICKKLQQAFREMTG